MEEDQEGVNKLEVNPSAGLSYVKSCSLLATRCCFCVSDLQIQRLAFPRNALPLSFLTSHFFYSRWREKKDHTLLIPMISYSVKFRITSVIKQKQAFLYPRFNPFATDDFSATPKGCTVLEKDGCFGKKLLHFQRKIFDVQQLQSSYSSYHTIRDILCGATVVACSSEKVNPFTRFYRCDDITQRRTTYLWLDRVYSKRRRSTVDLIEDGIERFWELDREAVEFVAPLGYVLPPSPFKTFRQLRWTEIDFLRGCGKLRNKNGRRQLLGDK